MREATTVDRCAECGKDSNPDGKGDYRVSGPFASCVESNAPAVYCRTCGPQALLLVDWTDVTTKVTR